MNRLTTNRRLYNTEDLWARRNPNTVRAPEKGEALTQALLRRILRWAEMAKSDKTGQGYIMTSEFKADLHDAVVMNNYQHSKTGLSKAEKRHANALWTKYSIFGRLCGASVSELTKLANSGQKIRAIKNYRRMHDVSLREAKDYIDSLVTVNK